MNNKQTHFMALIAEHCRWTNTRFNQSLTGCHHYQSGFS